MRRTIITIGGTVAGLAALLSFKSHPATLSASATPAAPAASGNSAGGTAGTQAGSATAPKQSAGKQSAGKQSASKKQSATKQSSGAGTTETTRTVTGAVESTQYGPMQVEVTLAGKRITGVKVLQETNNGSYSQQVDAMSIPKLKSETLAAQSAQIDAVSGASYTSQGYKESLQSALDKA
jgi:uncharacterized protein with FMN-binding domain